MGDITQSDIDEAVLLVLANGFHARRGYDAETISAIGSGRFM